VFVLLDIYVWEMTVHGWEVFGSRVMWIRAATNEDLNMLDERAPRNWPHELVHALLLMVVHALIAFPFLLAIFK